MATVPLHDAQEHLSELLARVTAGEEVLIERKGEPRIRLVCERPVTPSPKRSPGKLAGQIHIDESFFDPMTEEELSTWYDGPV